MKKIILLPAALLMMCFAPVQNGMVLHLKMSSTTGMKGTINLFYDTPGTRLEMAASMNSGFSINKTSIIKKSEPTLVYQLDEKSKTYSTVDVTNASEDHEPATATFVGNDSMNGFACKHVKVKQGARSWELWTTTGIAEYAQFSGVMNKQRYVGNHGVHDALKLIGAEGFPVKTILSNAEGSTTTELLSTERKPLDAALFSIPSDYKKGGAPIPNYPGKH